MRSKHEKIIKTKDEVRNVCNPSNMLMSKIGWRHSNSSLKFHIFFASKIYCIAMENLRQHVSKQNICITIYLLPSKVRA